MDDQGRVSLNALHKASGAGEEKKPAMWLRSQQAKELTEEIKTQGANLHLGEPIQSIHGGAHRGTYAHPDLAISYAGWISPQFQLQVNRTFRQYQQGTLPTQTEPQQPAPFKYEATQSLDQYLEMAQLLGLEGDRAKWAAARLTEEEAGSTILDLAQQGSREHVTLLSWPLDSVSTSRT